MRIRVSNNQLLGVTAERTLTMGPELIRQDIFDREGQYVGQIVYVTRRVAVGTLHGWRPAKAAAQSKLTTKVEAIQRLPALAAADGR